MGTAQRTEQQSPQTALRRKTHVRTDERWQSLYHFTIGGGVWDERLRTLAAYHHLDPKIEELPDAGLREKDIGERLGV